jgi:DNA-3-methyladenine glycosylase
VSTLLDLLEGEVSAAARGLLGWRLCSRMDGVDCEALLTEVEAYGGDDDPASHGYRGMSPRNASMFGPPGTLYVYRSYGVHWCINVVTGRQGRASAVLLRGGKPLVGEEHMRRRRGRSDHLVDGPGKLAQALGVGAAQDGTSALDGPVFLLGGPPIVGEVAVGPRIGITKAVDRPWRFVLKPVTGAAVRG